MTLPWVSYPTPTGLGYMNLCLYHIWDLTTLTFLYSDNTSLWTFLQVNRNSSATSFPWLPSIPLRKLTIEAFTHYWTFQMPLQFFHNMNNTSMNVFIWKSLPLSGVISVGWTPQRKTIGSQGRNILASCFTLLNLFLNRWSWFTLKIRTFSLL